MTEPVRERAERRRTLAIAALLTAAVATALAVVLWPESETETPPPELPPTPVPVAAPEESLVLDLYFPGDDGLLYPEPREFPPPGGGTSVAPEARPTTQAVEEELVTRLVEALLAGPEDPILLPLLPASVTVGRVYLMDDATVFVDLEAAGGAPPPAMGSLGEMLTVYSIVNSVVLNVDTVERVVLLWNGRQPPTFAGHLDTARSLVPNLELIAAGFAPTASGGSD